MAFTHGSKAKVRLDNAAGALQDITGFTTNVSLPRSIDTAETTVLGLTAKTYIVGLEDGTISLSGKFDPTIDLQLDAAKFGLAAGGTLSFQYDPQGSTTGLPRYSAEVYITSYEVSADVGAELTWSANLQVSGGVTRSTVP